MEVIPHQLIIQLDVRVYELAATGECKVPAKTKQQKTIVVNVDSESDGVAITNKIIEDLKCYK